MKMFKTTVLLLVLMTSTLTLAKGTHEVLLGINIHANSIELHVASGGCTAAEDFNIEVNKGVTGKPPYMVTVYRIKPDHCKAALLDGVKVTFDRKTLGLDGLVDFTIANKIGNTSIHQ